VARKIFAVLLAGACLPTAILAQASLKRPAITGISHMTVYAADPAASKKFYVGELGFLEGTPDLEGEARYFASAKQYVVVTQLPADHGISRLKAVSFTTSDAEALRRYLAAHSVRVPSHVTHEPDGRFEFEVKDPEGNTIGFEQIGKGKSQTLPVHPTSTRIIHVGFAVHNRPAADSFYQGILGFRPYWHGGMKEGGPDDWVSLQVPDGTDWLEYMLSGPPTPTQRSLGVLNHFSLGVVDINNAAQKLEEHGWHESQGEHRQEGRDGKRQLNVYDPDLTRVEFMEFEPFRDPCCSPFTASNPKP
jgi:catechol 2,3-dioxygenase-like lactoylglutathione lyase family enzyme